MIPENLAVDNLASSKPRASGDDPFMTAPYCILEL